MWLGAHVINGHYIEVVLLSRLYAHLISRTVVKHDAQSRIVESVGSSILPKKGCTNEVSDSVS